nr:hypothetical protein [Tanacetum cinerariifolium]
MAEQDSRKVERTQHLVDYVYAKYGNNRKKRNETTDEMLDDLYNFAMMKEFKKGKAKLMVSDEMVEYVLANQKEDFSRMLKAKKAKEAELKVKKASSSRSRSPTASTSTRSKASIRSRALIASTSNAQVASTSALKEYRIIAMTGCVLGLRALDDANAQPPSNLQKRKSRPDLLYVDVDV